MNDRTDSISFKQDMDTVIRALLLISKKLEDVSFQLAEINKSLNKENSTELVTPPPT